MNFRIFIFTTHKAGSVFLHRLGLDLASILGCEKFSENDRNFQLSRDGPVEADSVARPGIYAPLRYSITNLELRPDDKVIVHLRDPRDMLVSYFFSDAYSHPVAEGRFNRAENERLRWREKGIDAYVDERLGHGLIRARYQHYLSEFGYGERALILRYETMVTGFDKWLERLLRYISPDLYKKHFAELHARHKKEFVLPAREDIMRHKRKMLPGDYRQKLKPETIERINLEFADVMSRLSYRR